MHGFLQLLLFLLSLHTQLHTSIATPISSNGGAQTLTLPSLLTNITQPTNSSSNTTLLAAIPYLVPGTNIEMHLFWGLIHHSLDYYYLGKLLATAHETLKSDCRKFGPDTEMPRQGQQARAFYYSLGFLEVQINHAETRTLTWRETRDLMRGLGLFLYVGNRPYRTTFSAEELNVPIATGWVREVNLKVQ